MDATLTKRSMLVKPTKIKYQKEVLQRLDHKRIKQCHRRSGKSNTGKCFVEKTLEKKDISPNLNKSSHTDKFFYLGNKILSDDSLKIFKDRQRSAHFSQLTRSVVEKTSKTEEPFETKRCHKIASSGIAANNNFQYNHCGTRYLQSLHSSPLVETARDIPTKNSFEKSRKTSNRQQSFEVPQRNHRSNSPQHNGCGIYDKSKSSQIEDTTSLADESLLCLKRNRKSGLQATPLPNITRERFTERTHC